MQKFLFAQNLAGRGGGRCEKGGDVVGELPQKITEKEVKKMGKAVLLDALKRLNSVELKVLEITIEQLGKGTARLDYVAIARGGNVAAGGQLQCQKVCLGGIARVAWRTRFFRAGWYHGTGIAAAKMQAAVRICVKKGRSGFEPARRFSHRELFRRREGKRRYTVANTAYNFIARFSSPSFGGSASQKTAGLIHHTERGATDNDEPQRKRRCEKHGKRF